MQFNKLYDNTIIYTGLLDFKCIDDGAILLTNNFHQVLFVCLLNKVRYLPFLLE